MVILGSLVNFPGNNKEDMDPVRKDTFSEELERNTCNLRKALSLDSNEDAIEVAADFYRKYPMLIEHVRSPEYMFRGKS